MVRRSWAPGGAIAVLLLNELVRNLLLNMYGYTHRSVLPSTLATEASFCCGQQYRSAKSWEQVKVECIAITRTSTPPTWSKANRTLPQRGRKAHKSGKMCCGWYVVDPTCLLYRWAQHSCGYLCKTRTRADQHTQPTFQLATLTRLGGFGGTMPGGGGCVGLCPGGWGGRVGHDQDILYTWMKLSKNKWCS